MKAVLGIDTDGCWPTAADLFARLRFPEAEAHLVHCIESLTRHGSVFEGTPDGSADAILRHREAGGREALRSASEKLVRLGVRTHESLMYGNPAQSLTEKADEVKADLIVAASACKGTFGSLFFGSISKGLLTSAHQSILIGKTPLKRQGPLTAVVATDHSPYADRCWEELVRLAPWGIGRLVVMTANQVDKTATALLVWDVPAISQEAAEWVAEKLRQKTESVCETFKALGASCESRVVDAYPNDAIRAMMQEVDADLLIVGAQGHGFWERLKIGSISFHQTVAEPYNVLVVRA